MPVIRAGASGADEKTSGAESETGKAAAKKGKEDEEEEEDLSAFRDFIEGLDLEGLGGGGKDS